MDPLRRLLSDCVRAGRMPGAAWWAGGGGRPPDSQGAVGRAELAPTARALAPATPFDLASLTKPLATALILVQLEEEGRLDLEDPVGRHVEELSGSPWEGASLVALAAHTSGLPAWRPLCVGRTSLAAYLAAIAELPPPGEAGRTVYSDLGYLVLGAVLERRTGQPLDVLFRQRIAEPLGLPRAGFGRGRDYADAAATEDGNAYERALAGRAGRGHVWRRGVLRGEVHDANAHALGGVAGHAGLFATAPEVAAIAGEVLRPQRLRLGPRARSRLLQPAAGSAGRTVGWLLAGHAAAARGILPGSAPGHTGFTGTSVWLDPDRERVYVLLTNRVHPRVARVGFHAVRRGFHRVAARLAAGRERAGGPAAQ